ncbi:hypothetical protein FHT36_001800 [Xanthobacter sp. SG618]|uniref:hypothetical protein n=1 Tax=Xanthobacter sp. SG618 TaxID=2587121 RepID=UPI00145E5539|nr:hypothetical protein [Xanthobacter sp. SG618]NMN57903.1 hypothetical protein [Xanthobacter sp. SG618]
MAILGPTGGGPLRDDVSEARVLGLVAVRAGTAVDWLNAACGDEARGAILAHPAFPRAVAQLVGQISALYSGNRLLNRVLSDRGRNMFGLMVLYLDALPPAEGGGLTAARIVALCTSTGLCSRGRAKAMLALMRWGGYLTSAEPAEDRRVKPLMPQEKLVTLQHQRWRLVFEAGSAFDPELARLAPRLADPAFTRVLAVTLGEAFLSGFRPVSAAPELLDLVDRDGGLMVLLALFTAESAREEPPSIANLSRRFHLSRAHVLDLLRLSEERGLVERGARGTGCLSPLGRDAVERFFSSIFAVMSGAARVAEARLLSA